MLTTCTGRNSIGPLLAQLSLHSHVPNCSLLLQLVARQGNACLPEADKKEKLLVVCRQQKNLATIKEKETHWKGGQLMGPFSLRNSSG